jgi:hypothetical protein
LLAAALEPGNKKFGKKKADVGVMLSDQALSEAEQRMDKDPNAAYDLIQKALTFAPGSERAKHLSDSLETRDTAARKKLDEAQAAARRGEIDSAAALLGSLSAFRTWGKSAELLLAFQKADAELKDARVALRLQQLFAEMVPLLTFHLDIAVSLANHAKGHPIVPAKLQCPIGRCIETLPTQPMGTKETDQLGERIQLQMISQLFRLFTHRSSTEPELLWD